MKKDENAVFLTDLLRMYYNLRTIELGIEMAIEARKYRLSKIHEKVIELKLKLKPYWQ